MSENLNFEVQNTSKVGIRRAPDRYKKSPLAKRARFEVSEGIRPAEYYAVDKSLPVMAEDTTTNDFVVIPKGRILSAKAITSTELYGFKNKVTGAVEGYSVDGSYHGYDEYISNVLVPANGGVATSLFYTAEDVKAEVIKADGTYAVAGEEYTVDANAPIGVAYHDWFQDIRGQYLNYRMWPDGGHVLTDWYVELPFVREASGDTKTLRALADDTAARRAEFALAANQYAYLTILDGETLDPGMFVASDAIGNYKPQYANATASLAGNKTAQTVGKVLAVDTRFPKSDLGEVQTYPDSRMPGTQTNGLPSFLYEFVCASERVKTGSEPTIEAVLGLVNSGKYGVVRINLMLS